MRSKLLEINNLKIQFNTYEGIAHVINDISFIITKAECFGLVGETGCGKSVTALSILRLLPISANINQGEILFEGKNILNIKEDMIRKIRGAKIHMIFQDPGSSLNPSIKIGNQLIETIILHKNVTKKKGRETAIRMLKQAKIFEPEKCLKLYPHELSGGMQQRVLIALALACEPTLLIADEPTTSLDVSIQASIIELLKSLQEKFNMSILLITHNFGIVNNICDRVAVMYAGEIVEEGPTKSILTNSYHPYTSALIESIPSIKRKIEKLKNIKSVAPNFLNRSKGCMFYSRCPKAIENKCNIIKPTFVTVEPNHRVLCHLFNQKGQ